MSDDRVDRLIQDYLTRLDSALRDLPDARRRRLVSDIREHLDEALAELPVPTEAGVHELLDRIGEPEDIAAEAVANEPVIRTSRRRYGPLVAGTIVVVVVGLVLGLTLSGGRNGGPRQGQSPRLGEQHGVPIMVPNVLGLSAADASRALQSLGIETIITHISSATTPAGMVTSQDPVAGSRVLRGSAVALAASVGPPTSTTTTTSTQPPATTPSSPTSVAVAAQLPNGTYWNSRQASPSGTPQYFITLTNGSNGALSGSVNFLYQDGQTSVVFTFSGNEQGGVATLRPTSVPQAGSASQPPGTVPGAISAVTVAPHSIQLGECPTYLHFAQSMAQCTFSYGSGGGQ